jgi:Transglycosylase SLT domain/SPOR domain
MRWRLALCGLLTSGGFALASQEPPSATTPPTTSTAAQAAPALPAGSTETVQQALCRLIDNSARAQRLPVDFFTRLIWQESSFRIGVVSPAGAQGIAQFMPGTAAERGLLDPFDPEQAIPKSAELLRDHLNRFGNIGLAAAAYNGGPNRVANWLADRGGLPDETRAYVYRITARSAEEWAEEHRGGERSETGAPTQGEEKHPPSAGAATSCLQVVALLGRPGRGVYAPSIALAPLAPWGVQLAGNFSKSLALSSYARARRTYAELLGPVRPMVIGTRLRSRGTRTFYRVRVPASTRVVADQLCSRIRRVGGACIVLPS